MLEEKFLQGIELIQVVTGKSLSERQLELYKLLLRDIPEDSYISGIETMLKERVFSNFPMPAEIRDYCLGTRQEDLDLRVARAITLIKKAIGEAGMYTSIAFEDPIIHLVIRDFGGWTKLCEMDLNSFENLLKWDLPKLYKAYASRKNNNIPTVLEGKGADKTVKYIGDTVKAKRWILAYENKRIEIDNKNVNHLLEVV